MTRIKPDMGLYGMSEGTFKKHLGISRERAEEIVKGAINEWTIQNSKPINFEGTWHVSESGCLYYPYMRLDDKENYFALAFSRYGSLIQGRVKIKLPSEVYKPLKEGLDPTLAMRLMLNGFYLREIGTVFLLRWNRELGRIEWQDYEHGGGWNKDDVNQFSNYEIYQISSESARMIIRQRESYAMENFPND
jgi:hypothetical protein